MCWQVTTPDTLWSLALFRKSFWWPKFTPDCGWFYHFFFFFFRISKVPTPSPDTLLEYKSNSQSWKLLPHDLVKYHIFFESLSGIARWEGNGRDMPTIQTPTSRDPKIDSFKHFEHQIWLFWVNLKMLSQMVLVKVRIGSHDKFMLCCVLFLKIIQGDPPRTHYTTYQA